ncbi:hypothetical protein NW762_011349 [Fusarium torreyae]|uniref:Pectate lyase n=1 Tax=Fusarium torreyae TaxID=1237075 RepID=A0A9W8RRS3_9HYPO|nr:hypothetical protein NW762_011349 [Fusarium torreyae]
MSFHQAIAPLAFATAALGQTLNIPSRVGNIQVLPTPSVISGSQDFGKKEFARPGNCATYDGPSDANIVFILEDGATISNVIIGVNQLEGIRCRGKCTIKNVWFRDVCEDAINLSGNGDVLIQGGGAQNAPDKVVVHSGRGTVTVKDFTIVNAKKLYRSCGNCANNGGPRNIIVENVKASGVDWLVGINSNFGDVAKVSGSCGTDVKKVCQEFKGVQKPNESPKLTTTANCEGQSSLSAC